VLNHQLLMIKLMNGWWERGFWEQIYKALKELMKVSNHHCLL